MKPLQGESGFGIDPDVLDDIAAQLAEVSGPGSGISLGVVIGGGNIFRGQSLAERGLNRATGDYMGMLATVINSLAPSGRAGKTRPRHPRHVRFADI